jgi:hypothetical protein
MLTLESTAWIIARICLGTFLPVVLLGTTWVLSRLFLQYLTFEASTIYITQSLIIGVPAGIGAVVAWWNLEAPATLKVITTLTVPPATAFCAWLTVEIRGVYTYYGLLGGSHRVPVIDLGDLLSTIIISSLITANILAAAPYFYRLFRHHEN